jgi:hypothetical protein
MSGSDIENALILKTHLGYEDHGIPTGYITLELSTGGVQAFGGLNFRPAEEMSKFVIGVLDAVGVRSWEQLPGQHVRVRHKDGLMTTIVGIGNILQDKWYIPEALLEEKSKW